MERPIILGVRNKTNLDSVSLIDNLAEHINAKAIYSHEVHDACYIQDDGTLSVLLVEVDGFMPIYTCHVNRKTSYIFDNKLIRITTNYIPNTTTRYDHLVLFVSLSIIDNRSIIKVVSCVGRGLIDVGDFDDYDNVLSDMINLIDGELDKILRSGCVLF